MEFVSAKETKRFLSFGEHRQRPAIDDKARKEFCRQVLRIRGAPTIVGDQELAARAERALDRKYNLRDHQQKTQLCAAISSAASERPKKAPIKSPSSSFPAMIKPFRENAQNRDQNYLAKERLSGPPENRHTAQAAAPWKSGTASRNAR